MKNCRVSVYNINEGAQNNDQSVDATQKWCEKSNNYIFHTGGTMIHHPLNNNSQS